MATDPQNFKAPYIDQKQCWIEAEKFRQQHWPTGEIPVEVESIAAFELNLEIRPITGLKEEADVDAWLLGAWSTLIVDQPQYMDERFINWLRFSIAHELGHFMLHKVVFDSLPRHSAEDWIAFMREMPEKRVSALGVSRQRVRRTVAGSP